MVMDHGNGTATGTGTGTSPCTGTVHATYTCAGTVDGAVCTLPGRLTLHLTGVHGLVLVLVLVLPEVTSRLTGRIVPHPLHAPVIPIPAPKYHDENGVYYLYLYNYLLSI